MPDTLEQGTPARGVEVQRAVAAQQLLEAIVGDLREIAALLDRLLEQLRAIECTGCELRRACWIDLVGGRLVPVRHAEVIAYVINDIARIVAEPIEQLTQPQALVAFGAS